MTEESETNYSASTQLRNAKAAVERFFGVKELLLDNTNHRVLMLALLKRSREMGFKLDVDEHFKILQNAQSAFLAVFDRTPDLKTFEDRLVFLALINQVGAV